MSTASRAGKGGQCGKRGESKVEIRFTIEVLITWFLNTQVQELYTKMNKEAIQTNTHKRHTWNYLN